MNKKAVVLLSGGLDSTTCMGIAQDEGFELYPISFYYQQRHAREIENAKKVAAYYGVEARHHIADVSFLGQIGGSALTDMQMEVPDKEEEGIPNTYVPARNLIFLSLATAYAEVNGAKDIFLGVSAVDYSGYPDCRPEFIESMGETIRLATKVGVTSGAISLRAPLIHLSKKETIAWGCRLGVPYGLSTSCYRGEEKACGVCDSCRLRRKGFEENQIVDPLEYAVV